HVGTGASQLCSLRLDQRDLRRARPLRHEHDRAHADAPRGPRGRRAVVPRRRGDDDVRAPRLEHGERAAPLERAELVLVLALQPDAVWTKRGRRSHEKTPYATSPAPSPIRDRKSTRLNSSHVAISYAV